MQEQNIRIFNMNNSWTPPFQYNGPYPRYKLAKARQILVSTMNNCDNKILERLKPKIGLDSSMGSAVIPPPIPGYPSSQRGFGESSNNFRIDYRDTETEYDESFDDESDHSFQNYSHEYTQDSGMFPRGSNTMNTSCDDGNFSGANHWDFSAKSNTQNMRNFSQSYQGTSATLYGKSQFKPSAAAGSSKDVTWSPAIPNRNSNLKELTGNNTKQPLIGLNNTWPLSKKSHNATTPDSKSNDVKDSVEEMNIPVYYSGVLNKTSTPKSVTVSRPQSRNEYIQRSESPVNINKLNFNVIEKNESKVFTSDRGFQSKVVPDQVTVQSKRKSAGENESSKKQKLADGSAHPSRNQKSPNPSPTKISIFKGNHNNLKDIYIIHKCDFCKVTCSSWDGLNKHLISSKHFSGSLYKARNVDTGIELVSITQMLSAKNNSSGLQCFVVSCPDCKAIFEDIFTCGLHSKNMHDFDTGVYCISPVVNVQTLWLNKVPKCSHCSQHFKTCYELISHWEKEPSHSPAPQPSSSQMFILSLCPFCDMTFRDGFMKAISHVILKHSSRIDGPTFSLKVKEILEPRKQEELPRFDDCCLKRALQTEMSVLRNIEKEIFMTPNSKSKMKTIKSKITKVHSKLQKLSQD